MRQKVVAICLADIHWSDKPPVARAEKDWLAAQESVMEQVLVLQNKYNGSSSDTCYVLIAGDLFDRWWSQRPELVNNVIRWLNLFRKRSIFSIPGNHDTPNHDHVQLDRSQYWTLVEAGCITNLVPGQSAEIGPLLVTPFPHGFDVKPAKRHSMMVNVALIHQFIWTAKTGYEGAPEESRYGRWVKRLEGYDIAVCGDNHKGFLIQQEGSPTVLNVGTLMARHSDERDYKPFVGLIHADGTVSRHYLDISKDKWSDTVTRTVSGLEQSLQIELKEFAQELSKKHGKQVSFGEVVISWIEKNKPNARVEAIMHRILGRK
jgi:Calcineurin-like phosphoesterase